MSEGTTHTDPPLHAAFEEGTRHAALLPLCCGDGWCSGGSSQPAAPLGTWHQGLHCSNNCVVQHAPANPELICLEKAELPHLQHISGLLAPYNEGMPPSGVQVFLRKLESCQAVGKTEWPVQKHSWVFHHFLLFLHFTTPPGLEIESARRWSGGRSPALNFAIIRFNSQTLCMTFESLFKNFFLQCIQTTKITEKFSPGFQNDQGLQLQWFYCRKEFEEQNKTHI